jgi:glycosyltransferase involved in cell wall biosynthesis
LKNRLPRHIQVWAPGFHGFGGGITAFSRELVTALQEDGNRLDLWGKADRNGVLNGVVVRGTGAVPNRLRTPFFAARVIGSAAARRPNLILSTHLNFGPAATLACRFSGARSVLVAHGIDVHDDLSPRRQRALRDADAVWAISRWTRERVVRLGVGHDRVTVLSNTVNGERFSPGDPSPALVERYSLRRGEKVILTVARLASAEAYKGYDTVLSALPVVRSAVGSVRYLIVGQGDDRRRIERLAAELGVADNVTFCGFVSDAELPDHYRLADVFAMPSSGEGFGIVFLEAMACGTPVLGGNRDGTTDALADGELGELVDPSSSDAVARGLVRLLNREGPRWWFEPQVLRARMLERYGRVAFAQRVRHALSVLAPASW